MVAVTNIAWRTDNPSRCVPARRRAGEARFSEGKRLKRASR